MTQRNITTLGQALEQAVPIIDISSRIHENKNPEFALLSNLGHKPFRIDGLSFECLEGFLQCIKTDDEARQMDFCAMLGRQAKKEGSKIAWKHKQTLYWKGRAYGRHTEEYQQLISRAFQECYQQCEEFRTVLAATGNAILDHTIGKVDPTDTILTIEEFVSRLTRLREYGSLL
ncbi:MAG: hypothetical protein E7031_00925 [Akkermansiaceae bacterium]|nr:hypothetical protein [Akkermansiaceae bacterium]